MSGKKQPWAVLVCRFSDDADPASVLVKGLPGLNPSALTDTGTALDLFNAFFTSKGIGTYNAVRFFNDMSHGSIDLGDSQVIIVNLGWTKAEADALAMNPGGVAYEAMVTQAAQNAAIQQGVRLQDFYGIAITSHYYLSMAQGGPIPGGAVVPGPVGWAGLDYRWVRNNGIQAWGQEMGHGFGLDHSRVDGDQADYKDPWDIMSTRAAYSDNDPNYGERGPGINAWNMRGRGWLDESRVWHCPSGAFSQSLKLRPLHRKDLPGHLAAELPPMNFAGTGFPEYLVEYRKKENWDSGIPRSCVLLHRFQGPIGKFLGTHSYVMKGSSGQSDLVAGDSYSPGFLGGPKLLVTDIDDSTSTASVILEWQPYQMWQPPVFDWTWLVDTHGGLLPPGPPGPWDSVNRLTAVAALLRAAEAVAPELRTSVLEIAAKQMAVFSAQLKKDIKAGETRASVPRLQRGGQRASSGRANPRKKSRK